MTPCGSTVLTVTVVPLRAKLPIDIISGRPKIALLALAGLCGKGTARGMVLLLLAESNAVPDTRFAPALSAPCACRRRCCCSTSFRDLRGHVDVSHARAEGGVKVDVAATLVVVTGSPSAGRWAIDERLAVGAEAGAI